jgi:hypothetical protein
MSRKIFSQLIKNRQYVIYALRTQEFDSAVASLMSTEMYFRGEFHRFMEYVGWIIYWLLWPHKLDGLSVGFVQIQLRHWYSFGFICSLSPTWAHFRTITDPTANYAACKKYLLEKGYKKDLPTNDLARLYTGKARNYYVSILTMAETMWKKHPKISFNREVLKRAY